MNTPRLLCILLVILINPGISSAAAPGVLEAPACSIALLSRAKAIAFVKENYNLEIASVPGLRRAYLKLNAAKFRAHIVERCLQAEQCTQTELSEAMAQTIQEAGIPNSLGYGILIAGMSANALLASGAVFLVPEAAKGFAGAFMGQLSIITAVVLSPLVEPITSRLRRTLYAATLNSSSSLGQSARLHDLAAKIAAIYTLFAQHSADRITSFRTLFGQNLDRIESSLDKNNLEEAAAWLGDIAMNGYRMYREIPYDDESIVRPIKIFFSTRLTPEEKKILFQRTINFIETQGSEHFHGPPERNGEPTPAEYYRNLLSAWLDI